MRNALPKNARPPFQSFWKFGCRGGGGEVYECDNIFKRVNAFVETIVSV